MQRTVRIVQAPNSPEMEVIGNMVMMIHVPYSEDDVTMLFNPYVREYEASADKPGVKVRQVMFVQHTKDTITAKFDFANHNEHLIGVSGTEYKVKLLAIGTERFEEQDFPAYDFLVSWEEPA